MDETINILTLSDTAQDKIGSKMSAAQQLRIRQILTQYGVEMG